MKIKSLRLALCKGGNPEYPTGAGSSVNLWCGLDRRQGETTSAGDAPPVSATRERRARGIKIFGDEQFAAAFGTRGAPAESPGALALVTVLQYVENLTDRQAGLMVARAIDWKYALGLELADPGFDPSVLSKFRARLVEHGLEQVVFDKMLEVLAAKGMVGAGGKQRTDSTHVASAVRDLNRLELAGESVRACLEALAAAAPDWLTSVIEVSEWSTRYGARVDSWRLPTSATKRERLAQLYGGDALALLRAIHAETAPPWLRELPAVQVLHAMLIQNYYIHTNARGREVISRREPEKHGLPPAHHRLSSPYDTDARWAAKGEDLFWCGYKLHLTETCYTADDIADCITWAVTRPPHVDIDFMVVRPVAQAASYKVARNLP